MIFFSKIRIIAVFLLVFILLFVPAFLFYIYGSYKSYAISTVYGYIGFFISSYIFFIQFLTFIKFDKKKCVIIKTQGFIFPKESVSIPFTEVKQITLFKTQLANNSQLFQLYADLNNKKSIFITSSKSQNRLNAIGEILSKYIDKPLRKESDKTHNKKYLQDDFTKDLFYPNNFSFYLGISYFTSLLIALLLIPSCQAEREKINFVQELKNTYKAVIEEAKNIESDCTFLLPKDFYIKGKVAIKMDSDFSFKNWLLLLPDNLRPNNPLEVETVILFDEFSYDWGTARGRIIILKDKKQFTFYVTSEFTKKKLGRSIDAGVYFLEYINKLPHKI